MNYKNINNLVGWIVFIIATSVYLMTMEQTVSYWDCGEFLSCAYKVEVGHSPGAPLFMLIQRMFGMLAGGNGVRAVLLMNSWSAIASGLTILFLFWTITHFAKRLITGSNAEPQGNQVILTMSAGIIGGLAYTFSDTFWFSAVEAEVYATSSLFTALTFWAILKWEEVADNKYADRWLVFIAYMMGLSVGIHLLNLLAIPAIGMVYYYKRYTPTLKGSIIAFLAGCVALAIVQFGILQGVPVLASWFELLFVNSLGLPFDSGAVTFLLLFIAALIWLLILAKRKGMYLLHTGLLCVVFIIIGFSSYMAPILRSRADVSIDMTNPDDVISLTSYLKREQFGSQPLLSGPDYTSRPVRYDETGERYARSQKDGKDHYDVVGKKMELGYDEADKRFFPRIYSNEGRHVNFYKSYLGLAEGETPTSADNMSYFFGYQVNWMWWRYFMWNYAGRQNDVEGQTEPKNGNWISGIKAIDKSRGLGDIDKMPDGYRNNPARNQLYFLPFILGLLGVWYQFKRNRRDGIITAMLFFFTGLAIAIYLNMTPVQPRERDYAFAGSTYAFAIWIGLGVLMVAELIQRAVKGSMSTYIAFGLCLVAVPALMAKEEWDDHDRSKKRLAHATGYNVLQSCAPNAVLFVFGDNDTYPLWYLQEVEGVRTDVRIINMSLINIDWCIEQLTYKINDADAVPMIWKRKDFMGDAHNYIAYHASPNIPQNQFFNLAEICKFMISEDPNNKMRGMNGESENYLPTRNLFVPVPTTAELVQKGFINATDTAGIVNEMKFTLPTETMYKGTQAIMNIIAAVAQEGWNRPIYFGDAFAEDNFYGMGEHMQLEGLVFRLVPYKRNAATAGQDQLGSINTEKSYDLFMNKYTWGNAERSDVFFDSKARLMFFSYRLQSSYIAQALIAKGKNAEAINLLDKVMTNISERSYAYDATVYYMVNAYYKAGANDKAAKYALMLVRNSNDNINYMATLTDEGREAMAAEIRNDVSIMNALSRSAKMSGDEKTATQIEQTLKAAMAKVGNIPMQ